MKLVVINLQHDAFLSCHFDCYNPVLATTNAYLEPVNGGLLTLRSLARNISSDVEMVPSRFRSYLENTFSKKTRGT